MKQNCKRKSRAKIKMAAFSGWTVSKRWCDRWLLLTTVTFLACFIASCQGQSLSQTVYFEMVEERSPVSYVGNLALESGLTSELTEEQFSRLKFVIHNSEYFQVNESTGVLMTKKTIDREVVCPGLQSCEITVGVSVYRMTSPSGEVDLFRILNCVITINDLNDNAPTFPYDSVNLNIPEGNDKGQVLRTSAAVDKDTGENNGATQYSFLDPSNVFSLNVIKNPDGSSFLGIIIDKELNREEQDFYQVTIVATDGGFPKRSGSVLINITVTDVNDNMPYFVQPSYNESVEENVSLNVPILQVQALDLDKGKNAEITYQFSSQVSEEVRKTLHLDGKTGEVFAKRRIDFEHANKYQFVVEAVDHGSPQYTSRVGVTLHIRDVNDNAPEINVNLAIEGGKILETEPVGKFIAHVSVKDADTGANSAVICDMDNPFFSLEKFYDYASNMYKVVLSEPLDHEMAGSHKVSITCTDNGRPPKSNTTTFTVHVVDVNDNAPTFTELVYYGHVMENQPGGLSLLTVTAHDWDSGDYGVISYSLDDKYPGVFGIDPATGVLKVLETLNREKEANYRFHVIATDHGPERLSSSAMVMIEVDDENDEAPFFAKENYFGSVLENQPIGTYVGKVTATDHDSGDNAKTKYTIVAQGNGDDANFYIDPDSGVIRSRIQFDRETKSQYRFLVRATDSKNPQLYSMCNFTAYVLDDNDHKPIIPSPSLSGRLLDLVLIES